MYYISDQLKHEEAKTYLLVIDQVVKIPREREYRLFKTNQNITKFIYGIEQISTAFDFMKHLNTSIVVSILSIEKSTTVHLK